MTFYQRACVCVSAHVSVRAGMHTYMQTCVFQMRADEPVNLYVSVCCSM
jgi:hypothetical protein